MSTHVRITLRPLGAVFEAARGAALQDVLFPYGVEFPCGGRGRCKGCRVRVLEGNLPASAEQERILSRAELREGWRLACHCRAATDLTLELAQWEAAILSDETQFSFIPRSGLGIALDLGTTTIVAQLLDLRTANVLAVTSALNPQARYGADVMSRIGFAVDEKKQDLLTRLIREQTGSMVSDLLHRTDADPASLGSVLVVGNTAMHHLFCGIDCGPLARSPFEPVHIGPVAFRGRDLGWEFDPAVRFLPCLGGFVGSDILAGILAVGLHRSESPNCLIDLGTNGEIVIGSRQGIVCCSTAAGPAFEGARISMGMRAATGAIAEVHREGKRLISRTLGDVSPRGICGSGLVDAAAALLDAGRLRPNGRFAGGEPSVMITDPVSLSQTDIRELQLAKGAIAAGIRILLAEMGLAQDEIARVYLAGAFGNYVSSASARRIGMVSFPAEKIIPAGNTALRGAKRGLFEDSPAYESLAGSIAHIPLNRTREFQDVYVQEMAFPEQAGQD